MCENFDGVVINYQCKNISAINTINELSNLISSKLGIKYLKLCNISDIFDLLFSREERILFVIDEYPYLLNEFQGLDSIIQHYIYK